MNDPNAWALYWCDRVSPYSDNPTPEATVGDVDILYVQPIDVGTGSHAIAAGDHVNVMVVPVSFDIAP